MRALFALCLAVPLASQTPADRLQHYRDTIGAPSVSAAVGVRGQVAWAEALGEGVTTASLYRIGSVSKPMTAAALMLLVEEGRIDLDALVQRYVPAFPVKRWSVTTRLLAGHLAGVRHYRGEEFLLNRRFESVGEALTIFAADSLLFEPGTRFSYSSYGWNLISAVIERAAGRPFLDVMHDMVWGPLNLRETAPDRTDSVIPQRVAFFERTDGGFEPSPPVDNSYKWAGGGFLSTPSDLVRFAMAHCGPEFLSDASRATLFTSQRTQDGAATSYGVGWGVTTDDAGRLRVSHGGGSIGGTTMLVLYPASCVSVAVTVNVTGAPGLGPLATAIAASYLGN